MPEKTDNVVVVPGDFSWVDAGVSAAIEPLINWTHERGWAMDNRPGFSVLGRSWSQLRRTYLGMTWLKGGTIVLILGIGVGAGLLSSLYAMPVAILMLLLLAGTVFLLGNLEGLSLYSLIWAIVLAAYIFEFGEIQADIVGCFLLFSLSFSLGFLAALYGRRAAPPTAFETPIAVHKWVVAFYIIQSIALLLVMAKTGLLIATFGARAIFIDWDWRASLGDSGLEESILRYGPIFAYMALVLAAALLRFHVRLPKCLLPLNIMLLVLVMITGVSARRNFLFEGSAATIFIYLCGRGKARVLRQRAVVFVGMLAVVLFFSWSQSLLGKSTGSVRSDILSYVTWNLKNAQYYMQQEPRLGSRALNVPAVAVAKLFGLVRPQMLNPVNYALGGYNTLPYYAEWYVDVGYVGTLVFAFVWGYMAVVVRRKAWQSPAWLVSYGLVQMSILFSFRSAIVSHFDFIVIIVVLGLLDILFSVRRGSSMVNQNGAVYRHSVPGEHRIQQVVSK